MIFHQDVGNYLLITGNMELHVAIFNLSLMWISKLSLLSIITQLYFSCCTCSREFPISLYLNSLCASCFSICINLHLSGWNLRS